MPSTPDMEPSHFLDAIGELVAALAAFADRVPAASAMMIPGGRRPSPEAVEAYEETVYRVRDRAGTIYKGTIPLLLDSLEAFEAGRVFDAVWPLFQVMDLLVQLHNEGTIAFRSADQDRLRTYHSRLGKLIPEATTPEINLPPPTTY